VEAMIEVESGLASLMLRRREAGLAVHDLD
jgi:hypothetical protein